MALPSQKKCRSRVRMKRSHNALTAQTLAKCPNCGNSVMPHRVCANCGQYKGRAVIKVKLPKTAKKKTA